VRSQTKDYLQAFLKEFTPRFKVLEVGSYNENGEIKSLLNQSDYIGLDARAGTNVDIVQNAHDMEYKDEFDLVLCFDTLEHDDKFWITMEKLKQAVKPGGWLLLGVPGRNCPAHDHPKDYWRFMPDSVKSLFEGFEEVALEIEKDDEVYAKGRKPQ
jgi:SAM-dependent methyltransferase